MEVQAPGQDWPSDVEDKHTLTPAVVAIKLAAIGLLVWLVIDNHLDDYRKSQLAPTDCRSSHESRRRRKTA
jgi:hypothetical protein